MPKKASRLKCRICRCTTDDCSKCIELTGIPCHWVEDDLCSACVDVKGDHYDMLAARIRWQNARPRVERPMARIIHQEALQRGVFPPAARS